VSKKPFTILCVTSYFKGLDFMRQCRKEGCRVILLTSKSLENEEWPRESLDEVFFIPDRNKEWNMPDVIHGVSYMARREKLNRIVALDDFDVEKAAELREHLRIPGAGETTARYFRDKLAMRMKAQEGGIPVPAFVPIINYEEINEYLAENQPPYVLKPRSQASGIGIMKIHSSSELWREVDSLGDRQSFYLLEQFKPGKVYHVDSIVHERSIQFAIASEYGETPMSVAHEGKVFSTRTMMRGTERERALLKLNGRILDELGLKEGVSHTEFIEGNTPADFYFLETSMRVGGAHIADLIEQSTGINLWHEWAKIEALRDGRTYEAPKPREDYAGLLVSLARQEWPDTSGYNDPEVRWRLKKHHHAGLIAVSPDFSRIEDLMNQYRQRFHNDFFASMPLPEKATD
jgi:biotin carboxylase